MKTCAACHEDLPKDKFSKKQWKLGADCQRRCTSCVTDNREVQQLPPPTNNEPGDSEVGSLLISMSISDQMIPASDEELFKQPPPNEDCPICFLRMPSMWSGYKYMSCCGKLICSGCIYANSKLTVDDLCPFCRTPAATTNREHIKRIKLCMDSNDSFAFYSLGYYYYHGLYGLPKINSKAFELWHRAGELGSAEAHYNIAYAYHKGEGVERDEKKSNHYWELAAICGHSDARHNLGVMEKNKGNAGRALKHYKLSARVGHVQSLNTIKQLFMNGYATKDEYAEALRAHQSCINEIRSDQRDKAAACCDEFKYY